MSADALLKKLQVFGPVPADDERFLHESLSKGRSVPADTILIQEDDIPSAVRLVASGLACRLKKLPRGRRQISAYLLPGDFCDLHVFMLDKMDHTIQTLTESTIVEIPREKILEMIERPALARVFLFASLVDEAVLREWITNIGQRNAEERLSHFFCEIFLRMKAVGLVEEESYDLPITQNELADSMGLSLVHTNKSLRKLIRANLLTFSRQGRLRILDLNGLRARCSFRSNYLHLLGGKATVEECLATAREDA